MTELSANRIISILSSKDGNMRIIWNNQSKRNKRQIINEFLTSGVQPTKELLKKSTARMKRLARKRGGNRS